MEFFAKTTVTWALAIAMPCSVWAQTPAPGSFQVGQRVEAEYYASSNKWVPAHIVGIDNDGYSYKVQLAPYGDGKELTANLHYKRVRAAAGSPAWVEGGRNSPASAPAADTLVFGKYGCTGTEFSGGETIYIARGAFTVSKDGTYIYSGFKNPSKGTFSVDAKGDIDFKGGYLKDGKATKMDRPNRFFLVFPANPDHRWTCGLVR